MNKFVMRNGRKVTAKDGLLWIDKRPVDLPRADIIAQEKCYTCAERLVKELTRK